jgi:ferrous iron transport protein B
LRRAIAVAAPAGAVIWLFANLTVDGGTLLSHAAAFLDPFATLLGLDGMILLAFILGLPANEIVLPLVIMGYLSLGSPTELSGMGEMRALFIANGWTVKTALCTAIFFLFHWPCSTTLITVHKETGKWRYTVLAALLPTAVGMLLCAAISLVL